MTEHTTDCCEDNTAQSASDPSRQEAIRHRYGSIASEADAGVACSPPSSDDSGCCQPAQAGTEGEDPAKKEVIAYARRLGYHEDDLDTEHLEANLGLGCGNPNALAELSPGETVLDLGAGAGFDCFLAAERVGETGRVVGVDMTPEMVERARSLAHKNDISNVEFRLGEIEHLPVADESVDVIISNCVINLSAAKEQVFHEAFRVLCPGGRLAVTDVVASAAVPDHFHDQLDDVAGCVAGAARTDRLRQLLETAGFVNISIDPVDESDAILTEWSNDYALEDYLLSAEITAEKPL